MAFSPSSILIFGATGNIGQYITNAILAAQPSFNKVTIFTSPATLASKAVLLNSWKAKGLSIIAGDARNPSDIASAYTGVDTVVSCFGREALMLQIELLRIAEEAGIKWFFPSEYGTDIEYNASSATEKPHQMKLAVRKFVRENVKNMKVTYLVTGPYIDMYFGMIPTAHSAGGWDPKTKEAVLLGDGEGRVGFCTMADVGKLLVASLHHPEASLNRALKVQSFVVTPKEITAEFERQTGGEPWKVSYTPLDELKQLEAKAWEEGKPLATVYTLRRIWTEGGTLYAKTDNESIGLKPEDMDSLELAVKQFLA